MPTTGLYTNRGCEPAYQAASADCSSFGAAWGTGNTPYQYFCTGFQVFPANDGYTMNMIRCSANEGCWNHPNVSRAYGTCDLDERKLQESSPFKMSVSDGLTLSMLIVGVWVSAAIFKWLYRVLDGSPDRS